MPLSRMFAAATTSLPPTLILDTGSQLPLPNSRSPSDQSQSTVTLAPSSSKQQCPLARPVTECLVEISRPLLTVIVDDALSVAGQMGRWGVRDRLCAWAVFSCGAVGSTDSPDRWGLVRVCVALGWSVGADRVPVVFRP